MLDNNLKVIVDELYDVRMAIMKPHMPGFAYSLVKPLLPDSEAFVVRMIRVAHMRLVSADIIRFPQDLDQMASDVLEFQNLKPFALLFAYSLQFVANAYPYLEDRRGKNQIERFSSNLRVTGADDCEGLAKEMLMVADCIRHGAWTSRLALAAQLMCRCYTTALQLGAVTFHRLTTGEPKMNGQTADGKPSKYHAHAYVVMIPNGVVEESLDPNVEFDDLAIVLDKTEFPLPSMVLDGTNYKHPVPMPREDVLKRKKKAEWFMNINKSVQKRLKKIHYVENNFYQYAFSNLTMYGFRNGITKNQVFELYYTSTDEGIPVRGSTYAQATSAGESQNVQMRECFAPSAEDVAHVKAMISAEEHPIPPYRVLPDNRIRADQWPRLSRVLSARVYFDIILNPSITQYVGVVNARKKGRCGHAYLSINDVLDVDYINHLNVTTKNIIVLFIDIYASSLVSGTLIFAV